MRGSVLKKIYDYLKDNPEKSDIDYHIPALWLEESNQKGNVKTNFNVFYKDTIENIIDKKKKNVSYNKSLSKINKIDKSGIGGDWTYTSTIYNIFPRLTTAYDHDNDGHIGVNPNDITMSLDGIIKETGTFLKTIAMLPYIKSLGCNVLYFLPLTKIGSDGNKGDLGAPYAIKNQYEFDANLAEPLIPFSVDEQFKALVEAAHILGIRVVMEFVLRTSSLDGDWVRENPEWFYWIDKSRASEYASPEFSFDELNVIKQIPNGGGFHLAPNSEYRSLFKKPPKPEQIEVVDGKFVAKTDEGELIIPGAFADWPPDDIQPAWSDVTYLRMYDYPYEADNNYNYIAYNTIRYYDPELAQDKYINRPLWDKLAGVIPYYQKEFGIDGVMMDMGHAVPKKLMQEIITSAREFDEDFAFMEENFEIEWSSRNAGYNGTLGFEWRTTGQTQGGIKNVIQKSAENIALPFFGTPETHNTPRAMQRGGILHNKQMWVINSMMANCMPFIHSGFELLEDYPINTGLNFTDGEIEYFKDLPLGLFYKGSYFWNREENIVEFIKKVNEFRQKHFKIIATGNEHSVYVHYPESPYGHVVAFERYDPWKVHNSILVVANTNYNHSEKFYLNIPGTFNNEYTDYLTGEKYSFVDHWISAELEPGQCLLLEIHKFFG
ncbi:MAG: alpha-amylase [Flavobacteriales bacterium]|nr:alpha-amylase [Flavobacteriales bacterium]